MKLKKLLYLSIIVVCLIILTISTYYNLGGFEEVKIYVFDGTSRTVIGRHHIGKFQPGEIDEVVMKAKEMLDNGRLHGELALVEYQNDTIGSDSLHYFIGASFDEIRNILEIPSGFSYEEYTTSKIYRVFITQHPLIRPYPHEIRSMMEVQAIQEGDVLAPYTFDIYYSDGSLRTEAWVNY